jgi:2,3-diaminopropionate biosynthesis protein SbnB
MIYINDNDIKQVSPDWHKNVEVIENSVKGLATNEYVQPVKPYLRYRDLKNRIIAMPAVLGGEINMAGIKWIASFPDNYKAGLPRAHCVVILNNADTGEPVGIINSGTISAIRTASVSGFVLKGYLKKKNLTQLTVGIVGFGPIGQQHLKMCLSILGDRCSKVILNDINGVNTDLIDDDIKHLVEVSDSWEDVYDKADVFITCTVSKDRYIDRQPKAGSLHINVSLRDYKANVYPWFKDAIVVDNWEEICRENTDIEKFHLENGLQEREAGTVVDLLDADWANSYQDSQAIMFNPMGMAIFDIAIAKHYMQTLEQQSLALVLD